MGKEAFKPLFVPRVCLEQSTFQNLIIVLNICNLTIVAANYPTYLEQGLYWIIINIYTQKCAERMKAMSHSSDTGGNILHIFVRSSLRV